MHDFLFQQPPKTGPGSRRKIGDTVSATARRMYSGRIGKAHRVICDGCSRALKERAGIYL